MTWWKKLSPRQLNITIQAFSLIAIFFEGYDQGVMGGVNAAPDYVQELGIGLPDGTVTSTVHQGGIVSIVRKTEPSYKPQPSLILTGLAVLPWMYCWRLYRGLVGRQKRSYKWTCNRSLLCARRRRATISRAKLVLYFGCPRGNRTGYWR